MSHLSLGISLQVRDSGWSQGLTGGWEEGSFPPCGLPRIAPFVKRSPCARAAQTPGKWLLGHQSRPGVETLGGVLSAPCYRLPPPCALASSLRPEEEGCVFCPRLAPLPSRLWSMFSFILPPFVIQGAHSRVVSHQLTNTRKSAETNPSPSSCPPPASPSTHILAQSSS